MSTRMPLFDDLAWCVVRLIGLAQHVIADIVLQFYHPNPSEENGFYAFQLLTSMLFGGMMVFNARSPRDLPELIAERMLLVGRVVAALVIFAIVQGFLGVVIQ